MKRLSKMINGRSSTSKVEAEKMTGQKVKFASLHGEEEEDGEEEAATQIVSSTSKNVVNVVKKFVCNKCGKAFQSSKAMCGHMASHSQKEKPLSSVGAKKKLMMMMEMESDSETESGAGLMRRRSRRTRYKKHDHVSCGSKAKLDVVKDCSSEASGVEQKQEEVAISLMMLSRDSSNWGSMNSAGDSSENNSVVLEDRLISTNFGKHNGLSSMYDLDEIKENYRRKKVESLGEFDFGCVRNEVMNVETDVKSSRRNKLEEEPHLSLKKLKSLMDGEGYSQIERPNAGSFPRRDLFNEYDSARMCKRAETEAPVASQPHQLFRANAAYEKGQNMFEVDAYCNNSKGKGILDNYSGNVGDSWNKGKHDSPVCYKNLGSGNTLGYRCVMHSNDSRCDEVTPDSKRQGSHSHNFIDLNMPAPMEDEEANESMGSY